MMHFRISNIRGMNKTAIILIMFILALSVRLAYIATHQHEIDSDEVEYDRLATGLLEAKGYVASDGSPTSYRPPAYAAFLASIYSFFGKDYNIVRIVQAIIGALTVCLFYLIAYKIFNRTVAVATGIFSSFYMTFVVCTNLLYSETIFTFLLAFIAYLIVTTDKPNLLKFCALGVLCGFLTLTKSSGVFMPLIAIFVLLIKMQKRHLSMKKAFVASVILLLCFTAVMLPWTIRNYRIHGRFVPISTNAGLNMYVGIKPVEGKIFGLGPRDEVAKRASTIINEAERNNYFIRATLQAYKEDPTVILRLLIMKFLFFWNIIDWEIMGGGVVNYHFIFIAPFFILGIIFSLKNKKEVLLMLLVILYFTSLVLIFQGVPRYRMPIDGYVIMLGCYGIYELIYKQRNKIRPAFYVGTYFLITYVLYKYSMQTKNFIKNLMEKIGLW